MCETDEGTNWIIWAYDLVAVEYQSVNTEMSLVQGVGYCIFQYSGANASDSLFMFWQVEPVP